MIEKPSLQGSQHPLAVVLVRTLHIPQLSASGRSLSACSPAPPFCLSIPKKAEKSRKSRKEQKKAEGSREDESDRQKAEKSIVEGDAADKIWEIKSVLYFQNDATNSKKY